jgi:L-ascorbate metabolism protein UlaG (beta-lactamase superfamily)
MFCDSVSLPILKVVVVSLAWLLSVSCATQPPHPEKPHHTRGGFRNLDEYEQPGFLDFLKWHFGRVGRGRKPADAYNFPLAKNDPAFLASNRDKTTLTWIGHATVLLQLNGKNILTDPLFSERASPVQWVGPKRVVPPGLSIENLPPIDMVVISHDHYDALDEGSIKKLHERDGGRETTFFVPLGLKKWFERRGISRVFELDWWDHHEEGDFRVTAVPVQHWSKRSLFSQNNTLWAGWVVESPNFSFFFVGDSGYTSDFEEIGRRLGPFDLSAIPVGAYEPRWFMRHHHMAPEEAVQVHLDTGSKKSVGIHWGTFILTDEPLDEPPQKLREAKNEKGVPEEAFVVLKHGETIVLD